jgi:hypothetical protein
MVSALLTSLALAAGGPPELVSLEVGLVRISPHRPGTDKTWVIPAERKQGSGGFCGAAMAGAVVTGVAIPFAGVAKALCDNLTAEPGAAAQRRMETSPDVYVRLSGQKVALRSYTVPRTLSNSFKWRVIVPVAAIPAAGLVLEVLNDDGGPDEQGREVIGQTRLSAAKLLEAASNGSLITVTDGGIEKMEVVVEPADAAPRHRKQTLDVRQGMVAVEGLTVTAGEVVEVQARGEYRVPGRAAPVTPAGGVGGASRTFQDGPFKAGAPGAALVRIGKRGVATGALVTPCAAVLSPYEGLAFAGINNADPAKTQGDLEFDVSVRPATETEWRTGSASECRAEAGQSDDGPVLSALIAKAGRRLAGDPGLALAILNNSHPTGRNPTLRAIEVDRSSKTSARFLLTVGWKGGVLHGDHVTKVLWEFNPHRHISAAVANDTANVAVSPEYLKKLDAFFRDQVFPTLK